MKSVFARKPTIGSVGMGALYFFASHMVIRSLFYVATNRSASEITVFFLLVLGSVTVVHVFSRRFLTVRLVASEYIRVPIVSAVAGVGAVLILISILPAMGLLPFYSGAVLIGLSCGWIVVIWTSSLHASSPHPRSFQISPELLCAVFFYFLFRFASSVSSGVADGFLLALPLVSIACILNEPEHSVPLGEERAEGRQASLVLVYVSAFFALASAVVVHISGMTSVQLGSELNYMVLFEALTVAMVVGCCYVLHCFSTDRLHPRNCGAYVAFLLCVPTFVLGLATGAVYRPESDASLMWETSFWVLLVAVFAYDMRQTLYLSDGLAVGLMFESMCVGQMAMQVATHIGGAVWTKVAAMVLVVLYVGGVFAQLLKRPRPLPLTKTGTTRIEKEYAPAPCRDTQQADGWGPLVLAVCDDAERDPCIKGPGETLEDSVSLRCRELGCEYFLTQSEVRILEQLGRGRSARYIAEELGVSFNTVRTHIRHIYEKLGIHSKQELIDFIELSE